MGHVMTTTELIGNAEFVGTHDALQDDSDASGESSERARCAERLARSGLLNWLSVYHSPASWMHPSWLQSRAQQEGIAEPLLAAGMMQPWLREQFQIPSVALSLFDCTLANVLLLPNSTLHRLLGVFGLVCYHGNLQLIVQKSQRQQLFNQFGATTLNYIEHSTPLLLRRLPAVLQRLSQRYPIQQGEHQTLVNFQWVGALLLFAGLQAQQQQLTTSPGSEALFRWWYCLCLRFQVTDVQQILPLDPTSPENMPALLLTPLSSMGFYPETTAKAPSLAKSLLFRNSEESQQPESLPCDVNVSLLLQKLLRHLEPECASLLSL